MEENLEDPNVLVGEELLRKYFSLSGPEALRVAFFWIFKKTSFSKIV